ncbi:MAG: HisA/HisF family protein [Promethearchaeota archaeon]
MYLVPVIDVRGGVAVHGKGGRREAYPPVPASFSPDPDPVVVARKYRSAFGLTRLYVADLDAIEGRVRNLDYLGKIAEEGSRAFVDAGINDPDIARAYLKAGVDSVVVGTETVEAWSQLEALARELPAERVIVSLDLKGGKTASRCQRVAECSPEALVTELIVLGFRRFLVLNLDAVGTRMGVKGAATLASRLGLNLADLAEDGGVGGGELASKRDVEVFLGGGLSDPAELPSLARAGFTGVLAATVFYSGRITPNQCRSYA